MRHVIAVFERGSTDYHYLVPEGDQPAVGDMIITSVRGLSTAGRCDDEITPLAAISMARITGVSDVMSPKATKQYLHLVSEATLKQRLKENTSIAEKVRKRNAARAALDRLLEERGRVALYEQMAASDPEAAKLLAVLKD